MIRTAFLLALSAVLGLALAKHGFGHGKHGRIHPHGHEHDFSGRWGSWESWSSCSKPCDGGRQSRWRQCLKPSHLKFIDFDFNKDCRGASSQSRSCNRQSCFVPDDIIDGGWSNWGSFGGCSKSCEGGQRTRRRSCNSPAPFNGGAACAGSSRDTVSCNDDVPCRVDGRWGNWGSYTSCSKTCGGGVRSRDRSCNSPPPSNGGEICQGPSWQKGSCNEQNCPVNGRWSGWNEWSGCSCGAGFRSRSRVCGSPRPAYGGAYCSGKSHERERCDNRTNCGHKKGKGRSFDYKH